MKKVGLFGGTFDPVHLGHEAMVREALAWGLDRVVVMPCYLSPHKLPGSVQEAPSASEHRYCMLQKAFQGMERVEISRYEIDREGPSYTWQTLDYLQNSRPESRWFLIIGLDQFRALPHWHRFGEWSKRVDFLVFKRKGVSLPEMTGAYSDLKCQWPEAEIPEVSGTEIRLRGRQGLSLEGLVGAEVATYIKQQNLYLSADGLG